MKIHKETRRVSVTPTTSATTYAAGDVIGGLLSFSNAFSDTFKRGRIVAVAIVDDAGQTASYDLFFFRSLPAGTYTNDLAFAPSEADLALCSPVINLSSSNRFAAGARSITSLSSLDSFVESTTDTLYAVLVDRTGRTGASTSDITVSVSIEAG